MADEVSVVGRDEHGVDSRIEEIKLATWRTIFPRRFGVIWTFVPEDWKYRRGGLDFGAARWCFLHVGPAIFWCWKEVPF